MKYALKSGSKTVTTAGTRVALSSSNVWARGLRVSAPAANAGNVFLGDSSVAASNGIVIAPGSQIAFSELFGLEDGSVNLGSIYVDSATNGDKLTFAYLEPAS